MEQLTTILVSALVGGTVSYVGALIKNRLDLHRAIDDDLSEKRDTVYSRPWRETGVLPRRPRLTRVTYSQLTDLEVSLGRWYYEEGGLYLSEGAREAYSAMMDTLENVRHRGGENDHVNDDDYEEARQACSTFRSWLTQDLLSRRSAPHLFRKPRV